MDISLNTKDTDLKFVRYIHHIYTQGSVSQIFNLGPSFYFIESRKLSLKKDQKFPVILHKMKTKT